MPSTALTTKEVDALQTALQSVETQAKGSALIGSLVLDIEETLPLIREFERTGDEEIGARIIEALPTAAMINPTTGATQCCDREILNDYRAIASGRDEVDDSATDAAIARALDQIDGTLNGHKPTEPLPGTDLTVRSFLERLHAAVVSARPQAAPRIRSLASRLGVQLDSDSGLGPEGNEDAVRARAVEFFEGLLAADGAQVCGLLTDAGRSQLVRLYKKAEPEASNACREAAENLPSILRESDLQASAKEARTATVDVLPRDARMTLGSSGLTFKKTDAGWLIDLPAAIVR